MTPNNLTTEERRAADRLSLEIAALIRDTSGATAKGPFVQAVMMRAMYLLRLDALLAPERVEPAGNEEDRHGDA